MAIHKAKVIGRCAINGVAPGGDVDLDDEVTNVQALIDGEHIEILPTEIEGVLVESDVAIPGGPLPDLPESAYPRDAEILPEPEPVKPKASKKGDD